MRSIESLPLIKLALHQAHPSQIFPAVAYRWLHPVQAVYPHVAPGLNASVVILQRFTAAHRRVAKASCLTFVEKRLNDLKQVALVFLYCQQVVPQRATIFSAISLWQPMATDGIDGHDAVFEHRRVQQRFDAHDLVALATGALLAQTQSALSGKGAEHVQGGIFTIA